MLVIEGMGTVRGMRKGILNLMSDTPIPTYRVPDPKEFHRSVRKRTFITIGVITLVIVMAAALAILTRPFLQATSAQALLRALPGAELFSDYGSQTTVYDIANGRYVARAPQDLIVSSFTSGRGVIRIVRAADGSYQIQSGETVLLRSETALTGLDGTPDGSRLVYAQQSKEAVPVAIAGGFLQFLPLETNEWNVMMLDVASNTTFDFGPGLHPLMMDATHIVRVAPAGVFVTDTMTGNSTQLLNTPFTRVGFASLVSPDHAHMGIANLENRSVTVYGVSASSATEVTTIPLSERITSYVLGNDGLFMLVGPDLFKQGFEQGAVAVQITTLPGYLSIMRISNK